MKRKDILVNLLSLKKQSISLFNFFFIQPCISAKTSTWEEYMLMQSTLLKMSLQLNSIYWDATWKNKVIELLIQLYVLSLNRLPFYLIFFVNNLKPLEVKHIKSGNEMYTSWISRDWMIVIFWNQWILWYKGNNTFNLKVALFHKKFHRLCVCGF